MRGRNATSRAVRLLARRLSGAMRAQLDLPGAQGIGLCSPSHTLRIGRSTHGDVRRLPLRPEIQASGFP